MKLLMISTDVKMFEEGSAVSQRMFEYAKKYDELHIVVFTSRKQNQQISEVALSNNCWVYPTRSKIKPFYTLDAIRMGRFIVSRRGVDYITCQDPFLTAMVGISLKKQFSVPLEIQIHTDIGNIYFAKTIGNKIKKALALSYIPKADHIRVVSSNIKAYLVENLRIESSKIEIRPIFVDIEKIRSVVVTADLHKKYPQFDKIILMASRLEPEKNIGMAVRAFGEVLKVLPNTGLLIIGDGSEEAKIKNSLNIVVDKTSGRKLGDSICIEHWTDWNTLISLYKTADLFLSTSLYEGYGMTFVEAQAAGCPIISTDVGVAKEAGSTIVGYNVKEIAEAIVLKLK